MSRLQTFRPNFQNVSAKWLITVRFHCYQIERKYVNAYFDFFAKNGLISSNQSLFIPGYSGILIAFNMGIFLIFSKLLTKYDMMDWFLSRAKMVFVMEWMFYKTSLVTENKKFVLIGGWSSWDDFCKGAPQWSFLDFYNAQKWSFPVRISSVNVAEFAEWIFNGKLHLFFV